MGSRILRLSALVFIFLLITSNAFSQPGPPRPDPYKPILDRLAALTTLPAAVWKYHADVPHPENPSLDDERWPDVRIGESWSDGPRVLRQTITVPDKIAGYALEGGRIRLDLAISSDGPDMFSVFSNGSLVYHGNEDQQQPILLTENAQAGQRFVIAVRVDADTVPTRIARSQLLLDAPASRPDPGLLRMQILAARPLIAAYSDGLRAREYDLRQAVQEISLAALDKGDQAAFDASLRMAQTKLEVLRPWLQQFTIRAVGNSHIDMAWLWPWTETVEVVRNTFQSVLDLMREYPDFKFTMSSARTYEWIEEKYPAMFKEIEQRVKEGRWEVIGGMWVEPDLNMPSGESLVRQVLVGKQYFQSRFGIDIKIGWNPDSFGYNWQLPQIYKKSGMDYFVTQKLIWAHEFTYFPYKFFYWESPDGSKILTYFPHDYAESIEGPHIAQDLSEWAPAIYGQDVAIRPETMHLYGVGDHGGGPTRTMLDNGKQLMDPNVVYPKFEFSTATEFFTDLNKKLPGMHVPTWNDELYFEYHRGVFTTQAETKRRIRLNEEAMLNAEKYSSLAMLYGKTYPQEEMKEQWKRLLFDQFHDIMPGSGIGVNYLDAKRNLEVVNRAATQMTDDALNDIAGRINTQGTGVPFVVFNSLSWPRNDMVEGEVQLPAPAKQIEVVDAAGKVQQSQLLSIDPQTHRARFLLLASTPSLGYRTYFVRATTHPAENRDVVKSSADSLENAFIRLKVDPQTGCMTSLFDKRTNTESLAPAETDSGGPKDRVCGNLLQAFVDKPKKWDAWNIDADFENQRWDLMKADEVKLIENGPLRAVLRVKQHFQNSTFAQDITMYAGVARVDVNMQADWHEKHILLKVAFPLSAHNQRATFEIPYGTIERPTTRNTPAEKAKFEVPALRWADLSDGKHGFSLLNDCKYGYDAKGNVLRLSLLRSPDYPDPHADEGHHSFTYSLYPHAGGWREAMTIRRGYELNYPVTSMQATHHEGSLPPEHSFVQVQSENVVLTAVKNAEDNDGLVFRFYEWAGKEGDVRIQLPPGAQSASETDLMERPIAPLPIAEDGTLVHTRRYEIKTLKVRFSKHEESEGGRSR